MMMMMMTKVQKVIYRWRFCSILVRCFSKYQHQPSTQLWMEWKVSSYQKKVACTGWWRHRMRLTRHCAPANITGRSYRLFRWWL